MKYLSLRFPEGRKKALTFSYDDGTAVVRPGETVTLR